MAKINPEPGKKEQHDAPRKAVGVYDRPEKVGGPSKELLIVVAIIVAIIVVLLLYGLVRGESEAAAAVLGSINDAGWNKLGGS